MQKLFNFLIVGLTFAVLNVATVAAQTDIPTADDNAAPINEGRDMDVGSHRAAPIGDAEEGRIATEAQAKAEICKANFQEINARTFRNCQSDPDEEVDGRWIKDQKPTERYLKTCIEDAMWHNNFTVDDISEIDQCVKEGQLADADDSCVEAFTKLPMAIETFQAQVMTIKVDGQRAEESCFRMGVDPNGFIEEVAICTSPACPYGANPAYRQGLEGKCLAGSAAQEQRQWWDPRDIGRFNRKWNAAKDECGF